MIDEGIFVGSKKWVLVGVVALVGPIACNGDDTSSGSETASSGASMTSQGPAGTSSVTESGTDSTSSASGTDSGTMTAGSASESDASTSASGTATTTGQVTVTDSDSDTGACEPDKVCGEECCAADQLCTDGFCQKDCGGDLPCGAAQECCGDAQLCYLGECIDPGASCTEITCATQQQLEQCDPGQICDPNLGLCVPSKLNEACTYVPPAGKFNAQPQFTWGRRKSVNCNNDSACQIAEVCMAGKCTVTWPHLQAAPDDMPNHYQVSSIPVVVDLDKDCVPEIIFNTYTGTTITSNGVLRAIRGDTGAKVWTVTDPAYRTDSTSNIAVGDIDGDGEVEIVALGEGKFLVAFEADGTPKWKSATFSHGETSGAVSIANLDGDGDPEIVMGSSVWDSSGVKLYEGGPGIGINSQGPISCVADLNSDGRQEVIAGRTAYRFTGTVKGGNFAGSVLWTSTPGDGFCGIADLDDDKTPEVVLVQSGNIRVLNGQTGAVRATFAIPGGGNGGPPNIADFDGDGLPDIAAAGATRFVVVKFNGAMNTLTKQWHAVTQDGSSQVTGSSVFDFDGDGRNEVVYNDEVYLRIYPGVEPDCQLDPPGPGCNGVMTDAEVLLRDRNSSRTRTEYPVIADVDGDFKAKRAYPPSRSPQHHDRLQSHEFGRSGGGSLGWSCPGGSGRGPVLAKSWQKRGSRPRDPPGIRASAVDGGERASPGRTTTGAAARWAFELAFFAGALVSTVWNDVEPGLIGTVSKLVPMGLLIVALSRWVFPPARPARDLGDRFPRPALARRRRGAQDPRGAAEGEGSRKMNLSAMRSRSSRRSATTTPSSGLNIVARPYGACLFEGC